MDFNSLTRKELQSLCKLNKIRANITNVAMKEALQSLDIVEGIEKFISISQSESVVLDESKENVEVSSLKVPATRCRTTTRQKVKTTETENVQPTVTRTNRRGITKKLAGGFEESKIDVLETPALSSTRRKEDQKSLASVVTKSRRKVAATSTIVKKESNVQKTYATRRTTRQAENKSGKARVGKESEKAVKINALLDEINVTCEEVSPEVPKNTVNPGNPNAEVEDICNAFEEKEPSGEVDNGDLEQEPNDVIPEPDGTPNPCENGYLEEEKLESEVMDFDDVEFEEEKLELYPEQHSENNVVETMDVEDLKPEVVLTEIADVDSVEEKKQSILIDDGISGPTPMKKKSSGIVSDDKENNAIVFGKKKTTNKEKDDDVIVITNPGNPNAEMEDICNAFDEKEPSAEVDNGDLEQEPNDVKPEPDGTSNPVENRDLEEEKLESEVMDFDERQDSIIDDNAHIESDAISSRKVSSQRNVSPLTNSRRNVEKKENEKAVKIDLMVVEVVPVEVSENTMDAGNPDTKLEEEKEDNGGFDNLKLESEEISKPESDDVIICPTENLNFEEEKLVLFPEQHSEKNVDETMDVEGHKPEIVFTENADVDSVDEKKQSILIDDVISGPTPMKNKSSRIVSDDKENSAIVFGNKKKDDDVIVITNPGNPNAEMEDICNAFDEKEPSGEVDNGDLEQEPNDVKPEPDEISNECENGDLKTEKLECEVMDLDEQPDSVLDDNVRIESDAISCNNEDLIQPNESGEEVVQQVSDVITAIDNLSPIVEEIEVNESEVFSEKADDGFENSSIEVKKQISTNPSTRISLSKNDIVKTPTVSSSGKKASEKLEEDDGGFDNLTMESEEISKPESDDVEFDEEKLELYPEQHSKKNVDETMGVEEDLKPEVVFTENADVDSVEEKKQSILIDDVISGPTPMKKMSSGIVSDAKENSAIVFGNKKTINKEKDDDVIRSLQGKSLRQLKKLVKEALTLKTIKESGNKKQPSCNCEELKKCKSCGEERVISATAGFKRSACNSHFASVWVHLDSFDHRKSEFELTQRELRHCRSRNKDGRSMRVNDPFVT
ncbi:hypothetical protein L1887_14363 [Cichorium endivia]|nr:hypothetical protein L1887_14363 [Cichorium endivia]